MNELGSSIFDSLMEFSSGKSGKNPVNAANLKPSERLLLDIENYGFIMDELKPVLTTKGNQLIISCAGSGKTTALIFKVIFDLKSGRATKVIDVNGSNVRVAEKIWVATFLKTGADELSAAYRSWCYKLHCADMSQSLQFSTLHAEFKRVLNSMGFATDIIDDKKNESLLRKAVSSYGLKNANGNSLNAEDFSNLMTALTYTRNRLDKMRYVNKVYDELRLLPKLIDSILADWKALRMKEGKCDFEDLQEILYNECYVNDNQDVKDTLASRYTFIYLDEFQDTSQIQYALLKIYASRSRQLVAIGDDDQTIYSWRGSDNSIITKDFSRDFVPTVSKLSRNFRCPENILKGIIPSIQNNVNRFDKSLCSYRTGGVLRYGAYSNYRQMALALSDMVLEDVKKGLSVAILCRVNSDGLLPALFFDKLNKFSFSISGAGMSLESYMGRLAISIVKLFTEKSTPNVKRALEQLCWNSYGINGLINTFKANRNMDIWNIGEEDLRYSCPEIAETVLNWRYMRESMGDIAALKVVLEQYRTQVFSSDNSFNEVMRSVLLSFESFLDFYSYDDVEDFLEDLSDINERLLARQKKSKVKVRIATVHEFKGKEADSVYIWNDSTDVFPHKSNKDSYIALEEERRVHYIACTRAKEVSTIMYLRGKQGDFVKEMDLSDAIELKGELKGLVKKAVQRSMEETEGLKRFEQVVSADTNDFEQDGTYNPNTTVEETSDSSAHEDDDDILLDDDEFVIEED